MNNPVQGSPVTTPYIASTTGKRIGLALLGLLLYFTAQFAGAFLFGSGLDFTLALFGAHLVACAAIGGLYLLLRRNPLAGHAFRGSTSATRPSGLA